MNAMVQLTWLTGLVCAAGQPQPAPVLAVSVPAAHSVTVTPAAGLAVAFSFQAALQVDVLGLSAREAREAVLDVGPATRPGLLRTRRLEGGRWKCLPADEGDERWLSENHDELALTRVKLSDGRAVDGGLRLSVPLVRFASPVTSELTARLSLPGRSFEFRLGLKRPHALSPLRAEMTPRLVHGATRLRRFGTATAHARSTAATRSSCASPPATPAGSGRRASRRLVAQRVLRKRLISGPPRKVS